MSYYFYAWNFIDEAINFFFFFFVASSIKSWKLNIETRKKLNTIQTETRNGEWLIAVQITSNHEFIFIFYLFVLFFFSFVDLNSEFFLLLHFQRFPFVYQCRDTHTHNHIGWGLFHSYSFLIFSFCVAHRFRLFCIVCSWNLHTNKYTGFLLLLTPEIVIWWI